MTSALQAIVFDFDGVIADSEPLHLRAFQLALADEGIELTAADYYARYLGYDDVGMFQALARDREIAMSDRRVTELVARKGERLQALQHGGGVLFPGAVDFIREAAAAVPVAIASGALRHEIVEIVEAAGVRGLFSAIVAAGDNRYHAIFGNQGPAKFVSASLAKRSQFPRMGAPFFSAASTLVANSRQMRMRQVFIRSPPR